MPANKFHYIWMGRMPNGKYEDAFKQGPNDLAKQLREYVAKIKKDRATDAPNPMDQEIIMWVPEALIESIRAAGLLDPDITLKPVEDLYTHATHLNKTEREDLKKTVELLGQHNAYASQKDVLSAAILEEYGGYFLDTTTSVDSIEHLVTKQPPDVWFPRITDTAGKMRDGKPVILPDVWAMYSPTPGKKTFRAMLNSYVTRCKFYFPATFGNQPFDMDTITLDDGTVKSGYDVAGDRSYGTGLELMSASRRDDLIGQTAIFSLLDGVAETKGPLTNECMLQHSAFAAETPEGKRLEELGLEKFHRGMWRQETIADVAEDRAIERERPHVTHTATASALPPPSKPRMHLFAAKTTDVKDFKLRYAALKGDALKQQIIADFEKKLSGISDKEALAHFVEQFKKSSDYKILQTAQGIISKMFPRITDSQHKIDAMIKRKEAELENKTSQLAVK